jgi:hypothetical protein
MLYIHETTGIVPGKLDAFVDLFERDYQPRMEGLGARLVGLWETVAISLPWPQAIALWELDDMAHYARVATAQYRDRDSAPRFREWREALGAVSTGGEGRILTPSPQTPTLAQMRESGVNAEVCVHEWITTQPDKERNYAEQIDRLWMPYSVRHGRQWIGTYTTNWKNHEAISIWALPDGYETMPAHYDRPWFDLLDQAEMKTWMAIAIALRERYDDGLMHALRPTTLR